MRRLSAQSARVVLNTDNVYPGVSGFVEGRDLDAYYVAEAGQTAKNGGREAVAVCRHLVSVEIQLDDLVRGGL